MGDTEHLQILALLRDNGRILNDQRVERLWRREVLTAPIRKLKYKRFRGVGQWFRLLSKHCVRCP